MIKERNGSANQRDWDYLKVKLCIARFGSLGGDERQVKEGHMTSRQTGACVSG